MKPDPADLAAVRAASLTRLMPQVEALMRLTATVELPQFKAEKAQK